MATPSSTTTAILSHLSTKSLTPTTPWLTTFLSSSRPTIPIAALKQTALFRLLASDITTTLQRTPSSTFPADILNAQVQSRQLAGPIPVQVLEIEDVGSSKLSQVEAIEAAERGETMKGREVIRVVPGETDGVGDAGDVGSAGAGGGGNGPYKLLLQDAKGVRVYAFEMESVEGVDASMAIGAKLVLRNVLVARGVVMMERASVVVLGGKIEEMHKKWMEGRKERLKAGMAGGQDAT